MNKIYIEITNKCNFKCSFCSKTKRNLEEMSLTNFEIILNKIKDHTKMIYLHVLGEPLSHPNFEKILDLTYKYQIKVGITTNAFFIKKYQEHLCLPNIKKINISIHSIEDKANNIDPKSYFEDIFKSVDHIINNGKATIIYRLWNLESNNKNIALEKINQQYNLNLNREIFPLNGIKIAYRIFITQSKPFIWPSRSTTQSQGKCIALKDHIAILVNGDVVPCCLDSEGEIILGNIYKNELTDILNSEKFLAIKKAFQNRTAIMPLCQKCSYKDRFNH